MDASLRIRETNQCSTCLEDLDSVILSVAHQYVAVGHHCHPLQPLELGIPGAPASERSKERSVWVKDLDPVVARVPDADVALVVHCHSSAKGNALKYFNSLTQHSADEKMPKLEL